MEDFHTIRIRLQKIEFWIATVIFGFIVIVLMAEIRDHSQADLGFPDNFITFLGRFFGEFTKYTVIYLAFLFLNFYSVPKLIQKEAITKNIIFSVVVFGVIAVVFRAVDVALVFLFMFSGYSALKYGGIYIYMHADEIDAKTKFIAPGGMITLILWMVSMFLFIIGEAERVVITGWGIVIPAAVFFYSFSFHTLIPKALEKRRPFGNYLVRFVFANIVAYIPITILSLIFVHDDEAAFTLGFISGVFQIVFVAPFSWFYYRRFKKGTEEVRTLKKELKQSTASFDFLRSQINPHFLFNALNTLYGTALQEKADRTGEGIQRLGDMMRFMLHENMMEKISLAREVEYLKNYIDLQRLRTDPISSIRIETQIDEQPHMVQISPMLLIPFVENAFKHGISFREPSHIKIGLEVKNKVLYFDVYNSKHIKSDNDPEKDKSGIGLSNVKQRLALLYPNKHELTIRETGKEFFIHLTITLS